jgi:hypothetical protein
MSELKKLQEGIIEGDNNYENSDDDYTVQGALDSP